VGCNGRETNKQTNKQFFHNYFAFRRRINYVLDTASLKLTQNFFTQDSYSQHKSSVRGKKNNIKTNLSIPGYKVMLGTGNQQQSVSKEGFGYLELSVPQVIYTFRSVFCLSAVYDVSKTCHTV
jgi:hypothetical protein